MALYRSSDCFETRLQCGTLCSLLMFSDVQSWMLPRNSASQKVTFRAPRMQYFINCYCIKMKNKGEL